MRSEEGPRGGKRHAGRPGTERSTGFCEGVFLSKMEECCGTKMRELMSRCMARFNDKGNDQDQAEKEEG
jgi:hypothetical protein